MEKKKKKERHPTPTPAPSRRFTDTRCIPWSAFPTATPVCGDEHNNNNNNKTFI